MTIKAINCSSEKHLRPTPLPGKRHYSVDSGYFNGGRIHSYAHQIETLLAQNPSRILEIGQGPGMVAAAVRSLGIDVVTLDVQAELEPNLVGSVTQIPPPIRASMSLCAARCWNICRSRNLFLLSRNFAALLERPWS